MASFSIPLTGLNADSTALNTIANDLSNMNTTAFKSQSTNFADLFYQEIGSTGAGDPIQVGAGTQVASNETDYAQGSINSTSNPTDVALNGNGFFVVNDGNGTTEYTRAGNFSLTSAGNLVTSGGMNVMGYPAAGGVVNTNAPLVPINIPIGAVEQPQATTTLNMTTNLDSDSLSASPFPAQATVYDSLGEPHIVTVTYTQTSPNTWNYSAALPASDFVSGTSTPVTGTMTFDSSGTLDSITQTTPVAVGATPVGSAAGDISSIPLSFTGLADNAADLNIGWNLLGSNGTPTIGQVYATSAVSSTLQDGYGPGQYESFTIGSDGTVTATYSNGNKEAVGQLALANVSNVQGLQMMGDGNYATTRASGTASVSTSGTAGLGTLQDGALEASNVNISAEFSNLIIAQRAFEANSKAVTTFDTVTQETINMIH
ncbi:MAG TPA: flagellar hook protein FlgE [Terracidiphilus sp.]|nr:flagellar hook protein FlgE [Terracidiphilus sp.]